MTRTGPSPFARPSVYRSADTGGHTIARRLTRYAVLAHEPTVREVAADYWLHSEPYYRGVMAELTNLVAPHPAARLALARLVDEPGDTAAERRLENELEALLDAHPEQGPRVEPTLGHADDNIYIDYHRGAGHRSGVGRVQLADLLAAPAAPPVRAGGPATVFVIIPLRDTGDTGRIRNLVACLRALRDQSLSDTAYRVTVVESDTEPRWRHVVEPLVDHYVHIPGDGRFNKSWTLNVGVRRTPGEAPLICLLDADLLVDRQFLERNVHRFLDPGHDGHLTHTEALSMDEESSNRLIDERCFAGASEPPLTAARGLVLRHAPGGCVWIRSTLFHRIGGLDERYAGWGGEDEDMIVRMAAAGSITQFDDVMVHLAHRRPAMRSSDGEPFNAHIPVGSWTGEDGYGAPDGPSVGIVPVR